MIIFRSVRVALNRSFHVLFNLQYRKGKEDTGIRRNTLGVLRRATHDELAAVLDITSAEPSSNPLSRDNT